MAVLVVISPLADSLQFMVSNSSPVWIVEVLQ